MSAESKRLANQIVAVAGVVLPLLAVMRFLGCCDPLVLMLVPEPDPQAFERAIRAEAAKSQRATRREVEPAPRPDAEGRHLGAWYPPEEDEAASAAPVDPALAAVGGGLCVFFAIGAIAFVLFGGSRGQSSASDGPVNSSSDGPT